MWPKALRCPLINGGFNKYDIEVQICMYSDMLLTLRYSCLEEIHMFKSTCSRQLTKKRQPMLKCYRPSLVMLALILCGYVGCASLEQDSAGAENSILIAPDGKYDTGYYSNLAMELEGDFVSTLTINVTGLNEDELANFMDRAVLRVIAEQQVKMAKGQLNEKSLHLNLTAGEVTFLEKNVVERDNALFLVVKFSVLAETLVTHKELKEEGISPENLENTTHSVLVPEDPRNLFERAGKSCAEGFDYNSLNAENYFYYFAPTKPECTIPMSTDSSFNVRTLLPQVETFPEYDRLAEDGKIEIAIIFGAYTNQEPPGSDWGVMMWRSYAANLRTSGWAKVEGSSVGQRYQRSIKGLVEEIDLLSPMDLYTHQNTNAIFTDLLQSKEIIVYNGHSFYGSLEALNRASSYPTERYQILFMNSCWSYEYYTKQVFTHKATTLDPTGWRDVDVVNNTTYAYFPQMSTSTHKIMSNLLAGVESLGVDDEGRRFSWQNIIGIMNDEAMGVCPEDADPRDCRHYQPKKAHEVYGVSGVRGNLFQPAR
jgi:hypothetical protein